MSRQRKNPPGVDPKLLIKDAAKLMPDPTRRFLAAFLTTLLLSVAAFAAEPNATLLRAAERGDQALARALLQQGADVNAPAVDGPTPLHRAVAEAKLIDAETMEEASTWLQGRERNIVLGDRALIILLAALPSEKGTSQPQMNGGAQAQPAQNQAPALGPQAVARPAIDGSIQAAAGS